MQKYTPYKFPLPYSFAYFADTFLMCFALYTWNGNSLQDPNGVMMAISNSVLSFVVIKTLIYLATLFGYNFFLKHFKDSKHLDYALIGLTCIYISYDLYNFTLLSGSYFKSVETRIGFIDPLLYQKIPLNVIK